MYGAGDEEECDEGVLTRTSRSSDDEATKPGAKGGASLRAVRGVYLDIVEGQIGRVEIV